MSSRLLQLGLVAPRPCQTPAKIRTTALAPVKQIGKGEGSMNHAATAAAANNPPHK
jgi:hypothetical protein